ncbi:MAG TPA: glutamate synthase large subunit [Dongiaceae bacterium]|nr:glutamate synthase large subunit [Dongiaceae bacterium]
MTERTNRGEEFIASFRRTARYLQDNHAYDPTAEHDACGVGLIAAIDGAPRREVVELAIAALKAVWHRGAVDADGKTGDGAGIHVQIPQEFFKDHIRQIGFEPGAGKLGLGQVFLPKTDLAAQETCRGIVESEIVNFGHAICSWRQVPVNVAVIGDKANATRPEIEQVLIANKKGLDDTAFERELFIIRRRIEKRVLAAHISDFYFCSLSCRSVIYKGMFLAEQLSAFYPDLTDRRFVSNYAIYHQRYSTNTFPTWRMAQPFRMLAHNGEINTLRGNVNWMRSHEIKMASEAFGTESDHIKPIVQSGSSDSAALDAVFEVLVRAGRDAPMVKSLLIPEAWSNKKTMPESHRALYAYCNSVMEPWDGPAALAMTDGRWAVAGLDRNGLRPLRYALTDDQLLLVGSEAGMVPVAEERIVHKGRVGPGQMIGVDLKKGRFFGDRQIKDRLAAEHPYQEWIKGITAFDDIVAGHEEPFCYQADELRRRQIAAGLSQEDMELLLQPMAEEGKEAVGSMGDDTPLAVVSPNFRSLHHFFRQQFSQVTNPPIDSLRERRVMSLKTRLGNLGNVLDQDASQTRIILLESPVLTNGAFALLRARMGETAREIDCTFPSCDGSDSLRRAIARIREDAEQAVRNGASHLILTDEHIGEKRAQIPMILSVGAVHSHLVEKGLRTFVSLNVRSAECLDVHHFAVLIGVGATTINAYLAQDSLAERHRRGFFDTLSLAQCVARYKEAVDNGLLKVISKMGISVISSYRGGYNFEAVGLSRALVTDLFPGMLSRISGIGRTGIQENVLDRHARAFATNIAPLAVGGLYRYRTQGEPHALTGPLIHLLQEATASGSYRAYKRFSQLARQLPPVALRDLLDFRKSMAPIPLEEVESITEIRKRFVTPGMSLGALGPEAHETLTIAMNRIGAKSDSGEGGEAPENFTPRPNGDNANSAIKQIASARFGVTAEYLNNCREIEIKIAQGAKPGEGGQLPGFKVTDMIGRLRHATPGVTLISPPPHHDIYSIEDLAQLIYDLKQINPEAEVCVKLVAESGIGTIAAGVAKAKADTILVSGNVGGTGASPLSSIKHAGVPWEMGLSEVNQVLTLNKLRHRIRLRADGGLKTGRDIVMAAMMGAEEFGIGTASLIAMGCLMVRQCHSNTCPVGICTQSEDLRRKFSGTPEKVINLFSFLAEEVREILAELGLRSLNEAVGRTDLLIQVSRGAPHLDDLDLNPLLVQAEAGEHGRVCTRKGRNEVPETLDTQIIADAQPVFTRGEKMQLAYSVRNTHRAVGTRFSSHLVRVFGMRGLKPGHVTVRLHGSAGQSLGAFAVQGLKLEVWGEANDYVGKGLSGGVIVVRPTPASRLVSEENTIIGNTVLYGATSGSLYAAGQAGERFAVRNSGARAVIEGCGANGCEYMTGGMVAILGTVGDNFAAGMTGGMAFVYDPDDLLPIHINGETVLHRRLASSHWEEQLRALLKEHVGETQSVHGATLLENWTESRGRFWQIVPREMVNRLAHPLEEAIASAAE